MMFSLRDFLMVGFLDAVGKQADWQVIQNAAGWYEKNVLTEEDLGTLQQKITRKNTLPQEDTENSETKTTTDDIATSEEV